MGDFCVTYLQKKELCNDVMGFLYPEIFHCRPKLISFSDKFVDFVTVKIRVTLR